MCIPHSFTVGVKMLLWRKKYFGMKQPRSFDLSETVSNCDESSIGFSSASSSSISSSEYARRLGVLHSTTEVPLLKTAIVRKWMISKMIHVSQSNQKD